MGRPSLGANAKTITASFKISEVERVALISRYGSVAKGLRALMDATHGTAPVHRHRAATYVEDIWDQGSRKEVWLCACNQRMVK